MKQNLIFFHQQTRKCNFGRVKNYPKLHFHGKQTENYSLQRGVEFVLLLFSMCAVLCFILFVVFLPSFCEETFPFSPNSFWHSLTSLNGLFSGRWKCLLIALYRFARLGKLAGFPARKSSTEKLLRKIDWNLLHFSHLLLAFCSRGKLQFISNKINSIEIVNHRRVSLIISKVLAKSLKTVFHHFFSFFFGFLRLKISINVFT